MQPRPRKKQRTEGTVHVCQLSNEMLDMICRLLPSRSLANFGQSCKLINANAVRVLYKRNAEHENSSALRFAVASGNSHDTAVRLAAVSTFDMAIHFGADINSRHSYMYGTNAMGGTVLFIALILGDAGWVRKVLEAGADPAVEFTGRFDWAFRSQEFSGTAFSSMDAAHRSFSSFVCALGSCRSWMPLMIPVASGRKDLVHMLKTHHAPAELVRPPARRNRMGSSHETAFAAHHLYACHPKFGYLKDYLSEFPGWIDAQSFQLDATPLILSIWCRNKDAFVALVAAGANVNKAAEGGSEAPLVATIEGFSAQMNLIQRQALMDLAQRLLQAGADVRTISASGYSPLMMLLDGEEFNWADTSRDVKALLETLLDHGADVNFVGLGGKTAARILAEKIASRGINGSQSLEGLLEHLVRARGADLNITSSRCKSILASCWKRLKYEGLYATRAATPPVPMRLLKKLHSLGAVLKDREANEFFIPWLMSTRLQDAYPMLRHKGVIDPAELQNAYAIPFETGDLKLLDLVAKFGKPSQPDKLLSMSLNAGVPHRQKLIQRALQWDITPNYVSRQPGQPGAGFLHMIVKLLEEEPGYKESEALRNARALVGLGASPALLDDGGKTAIQRLFDLVRRGKRPYKDLRLFLMETREVERGELEYQ